ncbi:alpha-L-rhamnosidase [Clostridia bacterium]|nr:alpha-L-rhamnosidase [Clostridia bacterium]
MTTTESPQALIPDNVSLNYSRITDTPRSHWVMGEAVVWSWGALSSRPGSVQSAVRIVMSSLDDFVWDSGWRDTSEQSLRYDGPKLPRGVRLTFELTIQDDAGVESAPYQSYLYNVETEWIAQWIGLDSALDESVTILRRSFVIHKPVKNACLYACGIGYHTLYVDGYLLDDAKLDPVFTDYRKECDYVFIPELTGSLTLGEHVIAAEVAAGWRYNPGVARFTKKNADFYGTKQFTAQLIISYTDGTVEIIPTDNYWQAGNGAYISASVFDGTVYDARKDHAGWKMPGYSSSDFLPAVILPPPGGAMRPALIPPILEGKKRSPISVWNIGNDIILDFGQNMAGVLRVPLPTVLTEGQRIELYHSEELTTDGQLFRDTLRGAKAEDIYIAAGNDHDLAVFQPEFTYHGFRYAMIRGLTAGYDVRNICAVELHTALETRSSFRCGNALVTRIHEMCVETERGNMHGILTDCPQRDERMQWLNDATVRFEETPYNFDIGRMFPKIIRDIMQMQTSDGAIGCTAPFVYGAIPADPVCSSFLVAGYQAAMHTGNIDVLREAYPAFCAWEQCLLARSDDYIVNYSYYGDWAGPEYACVQPEDKSHPGALSAVTPGIFMSTGYSYYNCILLSKFAEMLGLTDDIQKYYDIACNIRNAMLRKWYNKDTATIATGSQACQAFALWLGIIPENDLSRAAKHMRDDLADNDYRITTGNLCTRYLMDMLTEYGYIEDAWTLITREEYPSYGFMLQQEASTVWERFELMSDSTMNSHNHPMYASVDYWMYQYIAGVRPLAPGWAKVEIRPYMPNKLLSAQTVIDTVRGELSVRWVKRYGRATLMINVPFGTEASVIFGGITKQVGSGFHTIDTDINNL